MDKLKRKIRKYYEYIATKISLIFEQKIYNHGEVTVKYMLKKKNSDALVIVFSACTRKGLKARYNYVKTLQDINSNRLYILDDYAADQRGSYYLGKDMTFCEEDATRGLIQKVIDEIKPKKIIFCGSSKGGYAALNFGLEVQNAVMVIGAPQYYLASYLKDSGNLATLEHIIGQDSPEKDKILDGRLENKVINNPNVDSQKIYLHFSNQEHTYEEHVVHMIRAMEEKGYSLFKDLGEYTDHSELSIYFPDYLKKCVASELGA